MENLIERVKVALRLSTDAYNEELAELIDSALLDLGIAGVESMPLDNRLIRTAVVTYCRIHFGTSPMDADRLKAVYDEQKAQLAMCSQYNGLGV